MPPTSLDNPAPSSARRASLLTIFLIVFIDLMGFGIVLPNLQLYGHDFGISNYFALTLMGATYSFFQFVFAPLLGKWSDRIGRRPVLLISQAGTLTGFLILFAAHFFEPTFTSDSTWIGIALIFISRMIDGISGGNISTASAYIADITTPENRARGMGLIGAAFGLGFVFGPLIGGLTAYYAGLQYVPLVAAAFSLTALILTFTSLPESLVPSTDPKELRRYSVTGIRHALVRPIIGPLILMFFVNGFAFAGMEQTFSLLIQHRFFSTTEIESQIEERKDTNVGFILITHDLNRSLRESIREQDSRASRAAGFLFFGIGIIIVIIQGGLIHRLTKRFGEPALIMTGPALIAIGLVIIGIPVHWHWPWTGFIFGSAFLAMGSSIFNPALQSLISRHAAANEQGEMLGASQGMASLARVLGPITAGLLFQYCSPETPYFVSAAITFAVALAGVRMRVKLRPPTAA